jgi:hypothetical protein
MYQWIYVSMDIHWDFVIILHLTLTNNNNKLLYST